MPSSFWTIRIFFVALLFVSGITPALFLKNRKKYEAFINNRPLNILLVTVFIMSCLLSVGLPSDQSVISSPAFLRNKVVLMISKILGHLSLGFGVFLMVRTVMIRRRQGLKTYEEVPADVLVTHDVYRYFRHPLYVGFFMACLSVPLIRINPDGFLVFPFIVVAGLWGAKLEEAYDVGKKFEREYADYKKRTGIFGPLWLWTILMIAIAMIDVLILAE